MSFNNFCEILQLDFTSEIVALAVRPKNIWILRSNSEMNIFKRNDLKNSKKYSLQQKYVPGTKMVVDSKGEKCIIILPRKKPLYFTITGEAFQQLFIPPNVIPVTGCWNDQEKSTPNFLIGDENGQIIQIQPGTNKNANFLYRSPNGTPILEIVSMIINNIVYFFIYTDDKIITYSGTGRIELIFAAGASSHIIFAGPPNPLQPKRILPQYNVNKIGIIIDLGALILDAFDSGNKANFRQDLYEFNSTTKVTFAQSPFGMLFADGTGIPIVHDGKPRLTVPLPEVQFIYIDENEYIFTTSGDIIKFSKINFMKFLFRTAVDQKDYDYANMLIKYDSSIILPAFDSLVHKKIIEFLPHLDLSIVDGFNILKTPEQKIIFLQGKLETLKPTQNKLKHATAWMILNLFLSILPKMSNEFKSFVQRYPDVFNKQNIGEKLLHLDWEEAPLFLSEIFNDDKEVIDYHLFHQNYSTLLEYLPNVKDLALVVNALLRIPGSQIAMNYISKNGIVDPSQIMLLLSNLPQISNKVIGFPKSRIQEILLVISHCLNKDITSLNNIIQARTCSLEILSSFCIYFKLFEPAAKALVKMGMSLRSIVVAYKGGISLAISILNVVKASEKKQCWMKLLSIAEDNDRKTIIKKIISSDLFGFEELLQFVDDSEQIGLYRDRIKESVQKLQFTEGECLFQRKFKPPQMQDFVLKLSDCCDVCSSKIITTEFIRFPCGHSFHEDCLKEICKKEGIVEDDILESCPLCGFSSLIDQFSTIY